jgi:hypothetical protein
MSELIETNEPPESTRQAITLYAILARDWTDFIELLPDADDAAIQDLHKMLTFQRPEDDNSETDYDLNEIGAGIVARHAEERGIELCPTKKSTSSEAEPTSTSDPISPSVPKPTDKPQSS